MIYLQLIVAALGLLRALATYLERKQVQDAERVRIALEAAEVETTLVVKANAARAAADERNANPKRLRDDDGHRRD